MGSKDTHPRSVSRTEVAVLAEVNKALRLMVESGDSIFRKPVLFREAKEACKRARHMITLSTPPASNNRRHC
jgi:hypothetical protein